MRLRELKTDYCISGRCSKRPNTCLRPRSTPMSPMSSFADKATNLSRPRSCAAMPTTGHFTSNQGTIMDDLGAHVRKRPEISSDEEVERPAKLQRLTDTVDAEGTHVLGRGLPSPPSQPALSLHVQTTTGSSQPRATTPVPSLLSDDCLCHRRRCSAAGPKLQRHRSHYNSARTRPNGTRRLSR